MFVGTFKHAIRDVRRRHRPSSVRFDSVGSERGILPMPLTLSQAIAITDEARCVVEVAPPHRILHSNRGFYLVTGWR